MVEMVAHSVFDKPRGFRRGQPVLGLALELRVADENRQHQFGFVEDIFCRNLRGLFLTNQFAKGAQSLCKRSAHARFMRTAIGRGDGVAIPAIGTVRI